MSNIKLNETPVRTAKNFNINNIKLENINIPEKLQEFENVQISNESSKIDVTSNIKTVKLKYGLSEFLENQVNQEANYKCKIDVNCKVNKEIALDFKFDEINSNLVENIEICAKPNTNSTVVLKYESTSNVMAYHNGIIRVLACENSNINVIVVNFTNEFSNNFMSFENVLENEANVNYTIVDFGGKNSISNYYSNIIGKNASNRLNTIYIGKNEQLFDFNYIGELYGEKSNIDIEVQGALKDSAKKHFKGTIDFKKGCKKATGNENENCMLLSDKTKSIALPMLLCSEEEVEGNHSSSAGKIGDKELFYIMSRGFERNEAMKLMVRAKFNGILNGIKNERLRNQISYEIDCRLGE